MNNPSTPVRTAFLTLLAAVTCLAPSVSQSQTQHGDIALRVVNMLEEEHYLREMFNDKMSKRTLDAYLEMLDYSRIYFTKEDVDKFYAEHGEYIDDHVRKEGIPAAYDIYAIYKERVRSRVEMAKTLAKEGEFTYDSDRTIEISRKDEEWATAGEAHDQLWRNLIEGDLIREKLLSAAAEKAKKEKLEKGEEIKESEEEKETAYEKITKRYDRILESVIDNDTEDVATFFIKAISRAYDPHSEYFSQQQYDNFRIGMNKSLIGIGAMLQLDEDGSASIEGLVVGGPAFKSGQLTVKDKVIGVAQGEDGEMVDAIPLKLSDIVDLIRGEKGTTVRLKVRPMESPDDIKLVDIVRDKVDLKDSLATADLIITKDPTGKDQKLGWIQLQSFYSDMDGGDTSTTSDVRRLITRLQEDGIDGLVVDLRNNGGGSLEEAINMTGLFIRRGPVVQARDWRGQRTQKDSRSRDAYYDGPLVVLTNRASASASEIFAAALQDYNRAVIVGEKSTFGKGTVQQLRPVMSNRLILPFNREASQKGALKLTIQTFFRIDGDSTQLKGVIPDIRLPSVLDVAEIGEEALSNPLDVEPIPPAAYAPYFEQPLPEEVLQKSSEARVASGQAFEYILQDVQSEQERREENAISLNLEKRIQESEDREKERETRKAERIERFAQIREEEKDLFTVYTFTQSNVTEEELTLKSDLSEEELSGMSRGKSDEENEEDKALEYPHNFDPYERETIRIIQDLIAISRTGSPVNFSEADTKPKPREATVPIVPNPTGQPN